MTHRDGAPADIRQIEHCWIPLEDGVRLSARLWLPCSADAQPVPAILEYIPYRKRDLVRARDERNHPYFARNGYACVRVDMRGSGDSEGLMTDMYSAEELDDAVAVIDWIARQPWCDGAVGMMGTSWGGTSALQAASKRPAPLKAVIAVCATNDRYADDIHHLGACLLTDTVEWGATLPAILALPPDPETVGPGWRRQWFERLEQAGFPLEAWIRHQFRDDYWRWGSVREKPEAITCPTLLIGGWTDRYSDTVMNHLAKAHDQCWGIVGPWGHQYPDVGVPGPGIGFQQVALEWWHRWLKEAENYVEEAPRLRVWMQGYDAPEHQLLTRSGRWVGEDDWPSPKIEQRPLRLGVGTLGSRAVQDDHSLTVPWRLEAGQASGDTGYFGRVGGLPLDQRPDDELSLVFDSDPLTEPVEILGSAQLELELKSDQPWAMLVARLNDVPPTGGVARVSWCVSNLGVDESGGAPDPMTPGKRRRIRLQFANTGYRFESGHRIRLSLSSSYWPLIWPNPKATQITVHLSPESRLTLPVRRPGAETLNVEFPKPLGVQTGETEVLSAPPIRRWTKTDPTTGLRETGWQQPLTRIHHSSIDREHGFTTTAQYRIDPASPVSAEAKFEHELHVRDRDGEVKALCHASLRGSESHFVCRVALQVHENRSIVFEREWDSTIERLCG